MTFFSKFGVRRKNDPGRIGISIAPNHICAAELELIPGEHAALRGLCYEACDSEEDMAATFAKIKAGRSKTNSVVPISGYQLLLVEAPDVPEAELRAAVRWRIKDLIDFHVDDAIIDVFEMPEQSRGGQTRMMYTVAARTDVVQQHVDLITGRGMTLDAIDIPELCLRNIAAVLPEDPDGVALLHLADDHGMLTITRQGLVYLTRRIDTGVNALQDAEGLRGSLVEGLALEVRRSLDYFESHYDQKPIRKLYVTGLEDGEINDLSIELSLSVQRLTLRDFLNTDERHDADLERRCMPAIGAALRVDQVSL